MNRHFKRPNPEVYRLAAQKIADGENSYTCLAIASALLNIYGDVLGRELESLYRTQYAAMFGPYVPGTSAVDSFHPYDVHRFYVRGMFIRQKHPYWNHPSTRDRQEMRKLALLLMADICEQGFA